MKTKIHTLLWAFTALLVVSCGPITKIVTPQSYAQAVTGVKPLHIGKVTPLKNGAYHTQVYDRSVVFMAITQLIDPSHIEVFDLDHNGTYDAVFMLTKGAWNIGTTEEFKDTYKTKIPFTLSSKEVDHWINQSLDMHQKIQEQKPRVKPSAPKTVPPSKKELPIKAEPLITPSTPTVHKVEAPAVQPTPPPVQTEYDGSTIQLKPLNAFDATQ